MARRAAHDLEDAIHQAVRDEVQSSGYYSVTFEGVARRVRTSKPVLYRRYRSRAHMVFEAFSSTEGPPAMISTSSGSLRTDLLEVLTRALDRFAPMGASAFRAVLAEADTELFGLAAGMVGRLSEQLDAVVLQAARARGEIGSAPIPSRIVELPIDLLRERVIFNAGSPEALTEIVDTIYLPLLRSVSFR